MIRKKKKRNRLMRFSHKCNINKHLNVSRNSSMVLIILVSLNRPAKGTLLYWWEMRNSKKRFHVSRTPHSMFNRNYWKILFQKLYLHWHKNLYIMQLHFLFDYVKYLLKMIAYNTGVEKVQTILYCEQNFTLIRSYHSNIY